MTSKDRGLGVGASPALDRAMKKLHAAWEAVQLAEVELELAMKEAADGDARLRQGLLEAHAALRYAYKDQRLDLNELLRLGVVETPTEDVDVLR